jgi:hypothetical protein
MSDNVSGFPNSAKLARVHASARTVTAAELGRRAAKPPGAGNPLSYVTCATRGRVNSYGSARRIGLYRPILHAVKGDTFSSYGMSRS